MASAFGLQRLLALRGVPSKLVYEGALQRDSLHRMVAELGIEIASARSVRIQGADPIVVVDGCKGNRNVTDLPGDEVAVIDHHQVTAPESVPFVDIRPTWGACSSIMSAYWREAGETIPLQVATALMIGINMDTALLTRGVSRDDIVAYAELYVAADVTLENSILRNFIQTRDLGFYHYALEHVRISDAVVFCFFPDGCSQNLLGILGDFFIALQEAEFVVLGARNDGVVNVSVRSERRQWNASQVVQAALAGIGFGGGHADMAGGLVPAPGIGEQELERRFRACLKAG